MYVNIYIYTYICIYIYIYIQLPPIKSAVFEIIHFERNNIFLRNATNQGCLAPLVREIYPFRVFPIFIVQ